MADRPTIDVATPAGGWGAPWPNVAEIEAVLPHDKWTAFAAERIDAPGRRGRGGLMTPSVKQMVEEARAMASRTIRRRAASSIEAGRGGCSYRRAGDLTFLMFPGSVHHFVLIKWCKIGL
ncbi:hypothetical protein [Nocardioides sp.]|uniref:hypothetical protein n=1 Tax=Nocardioides sp. TaxID=35761 RepID=UPI0027361C0B|nr:hypothetical protein [Nocardioides sp.]MDP3894373.1 hypothetical protein [Nocardioides sp.]